MWWECVCEREGVIHADLDTKLSVGGTSSRAESCLIVSKEGTKEGTSVTLWDSGAPFFKNSSEQNFLVWGSCKGSYS